MRPGAAEPDDPEEEDGGGSIMQDNQNLEITPPGQARIRRFLSPDKTLVTTEGRFTDLFEAWLRHVRIWEGEPDGLSTVMMRQGLAAACLVMTNRPPYETLAWTLNIHHPPTNLFLTSDGQRGNVTGRVLTQGVHTEGMSRFFVEIARPGQEPHLSSVEVKGLDILVLFEQYYQASEQYPARFFERDDDRFVMVLSLPGADNGRLMAMDAEEADRLLEGSSDLQSRTFVFDCGCNPDRMLLTVKSIFQQDPEELFRGEEKVEAHCPRCGRRWWITKEQFDSGE